MINLNKNDGFTIAEVIMASIVMGLIVLAIVSVYTLLRNEWSTEIAQMNLQRQARGVMEQMVRGVNGKDGIREASSTNPSNAIDATSLKYTSGIDGQERGFYLSGDKIMYDPVSGSDVIIAENITLSGLQFSPSSSSSTVIIKLNLDDNVLGKKISVDLSTQVKFRN